MAGFRQPGRGRELITSTGDITLTTNDLGKTYANVGAGASAVVVTLPAPSDCPPGSDILVLSCSTSNLTIQSGTANTMIALNTITGKTKVALSTSAEQAGGAFLFTCVGSLWHAAHLTDETQTVTVSS